MDEKKDKDDVNQKESLPVDQKIENLDNNNSVINNDSNNDSNNDISNNNDNKNNKNKQPQQNKQNQNKQNQNQLINKGLSDSYKRINFLYQASTLMLNSTNNLPISSFYCKTLKRIAQKQVIHVNPSIKRTVCKKCSSLLVPGHTSTVRIRDSRESHTVITCNNCKKVKRFNSNKKKNRINKHQQLKTQ